MAIGGKAFTSLANDKPVVKTKSMSIAEAKSKNVFGPKMNPELQKQENRNMTSSVQYQKLSILHKPEKSNLPIKIESVVSLPESNFSMSPKNSR